MGLAVTGAAGARAGEIRLAMRPAAAPDGSQSLGTLPASTPIATTIVLRPRDPATLSAYAAAVSDPASPFYHQFLSVGQFAADFGPTPAQLATVRVALLAEGLTLGPVASNGLSFSARADAGAVGRAFGVSLHRLRLRGGASAYANAQAPELPAAIAPLVQSVVGLDTAHSLHPVDVARAPRVRATRSRGQVQTGGPTGCKAAAGTAYTADQIAGTYGFSGLYGTGDLGQGQTIALYELEPFSASDIATYQSCYGTQTALRTTTVDGGAGSGSGSGEAALDVEDVIGLAPHATVAVYEGPNGGNGPYDTLAQIVSDDTAHVISTSWGICEAQLGATDAQAESTLLQEAAVQGQSVFAPAGDDGADDCGDGSIGVDDPASQPYVTGVGGTSLPAAGDPSSQTVWNDGTPREPAAGGGGVSALWAQPSWQIGHVVSQSSQACQSGTVCREVPDVAADADPRTGYAIFYTDPQYGGAWYAFGGTSAAAPTWAALTALADASSACAGHPVGFIDPALYTRAPASDFTDITTGTNAVDGAGGFSALPGYDMASGLGTPVGSQLAGALCAGGGPQTATTSSTTTSRPTTTTSTSQTTTTTTSQTTTGPPTPASGITLSNLGKLVSRVGAGVSVRLPASDHRGLPLSFTATGLPAGLWLNPRTGLIGGHATRPGRSVVYVQATDSSGASSLTRFAWTVEGLPTVHRAALTRAAHDRIGLVVTLLAGSLAPPVAELDLGASGISFAGSSRTLDRDVRVLAGRTRLRARLNRVHGRLRVRLALPAGTVTVEVTPGAMTARRGVRSVRLSGTVTDASGASSPLG